MRALTLFLLLFVFVSCSGNKQVAKDKLPDFLNLKVYKQQTYPGVESDLWYTMKYRAEFDLRTTDLVTFNYILVNQDTVPVRMLMSGRFLLQEKSLRADTDLVSLTAEHQVKRSDGPAANETHTPKSRPKIMLNYTFNNKSESIEITEIIQEATIAYPSAPPRGDN